MGTWLDQTRIGGASILEWTGLLVWTLAVGLAGGVVAMIITVNVMRCFRRNGERMIRYLKRFWWFLVARWRAREVIRCARVYADRHGRLPDLDCAWIHRQGVTYICLRDLHLAIWRHSKARSMVERYGGKREPPLLPTPQADPLRESALLVCRTPWESYLRVGDRVYYESLYTRLGVGGGLEGTIERLLPYLALVRAGDALRRVPLALIRSKFDQEKQKWLLRPSDDH